ncbi:efflux RND transporter periplasmic adaptor subunit [Aquabacterium sp. A7-Y]|uniref:efflux RND transporter periplasmic adaptor subunit n=1 Tax=Aquabacterium sp. A7-Y TaxID=1349605 RepID=UPI00223D7F64|nr:efflux RND transporter periplasmic adaptor subunit [Aquabacterium sp. A7-Y]MCW7541478.1 efflux RND transporter periplasmic adaptor subunit [Aquabacterium sp. A7-Y]
MRTLHPPLFATLVLALGLAGCSKPAPAPEPVRAVRTMTVASATAAAKLEYAAEVRARTESRLGFRVPGKMVRRSVDLGDVVKNGQVLAQLDPQDLRLGQEAARAALSAAQASFDQAQADYKRFKELRDQGFISSAELERRDTALKSAQAQLQQAQAQASTQGNQAAYAALVADASGVVTAVEAEPGAVVAAGTPVLRLAHDGPRDVVFSVPEDKVALFKQLAEQGATLQVRLWSDQGQSLPARIRELAASADPVTRTYLVKADIGRPEVKLGQTASVQVNLPQTTAGTRLPLSALREDPSGSAVWLLDRQTMTVKSQPVRVAGAEGNEVLIAGGLQPGQTVVTAGVHVLTPGQKVKLYQERGVQAAAAVPAGAQVAATPQPADKQGN